MARRPTEDRHGPATDCRRPAAAGAGWLRQPLDAASSWFRLVPDGFGRLRHGWPRLAAAGSGKSGQATERGET